ncbi:DUF3151 domain-containing protein [Luteimicrobium subarcticum]|uniref:Uncharacterized protein DUF3151 n=1 Tax=Luteimicrobium subarcticum TaxID=620910 RepID=A0A2M8WS36_9MICO|nr:DUF3151 domain-containing protein [Luteimicrobium subarcticum]PJI93772.1 uncharacterized protein DUF3151 [Luteimicrobium subarcticum]
MSTHANLLGPEPVRLPDHDVDVRAALAAGDAPSTVAAGHPSSSLAWAVLAEVALAGEGTEDAVRAYAFARTGYHRGLDALRRAGWRGQGPIPVDHVPNQGFLRALVALADAAGRIGEDDEAQRCTTFVADSDVDVAAVRALV